MPSRKARSFARPAQPWQGSCLVLAMALFAVGAGRAPAEQLHGWKLKRALEAPQKAKEALARYHEIFARDRRSIEEKLKDPPPHWYDPHAHWKAPTLEESIAIQKWQVDRGVRFDEERIDEGKADSPRRRRIAKGRADGQIFWPPEKFITSFHQGTTGNVSLLLHGNRQTPGELELLIAQRVAAGDTVIASQSFAWGLAKRGWEPSNPLAGRVQVHDNNAIPNAFEPFIDLEYALAAIGWGERHVDRAHGGRLYVIGQSRGATQGAFAAAVTGKVDKLVLCSPFLPAESGLGDRIFDALCAVDRRLPGRPISHVVNVVPRPPLDALNYAIARGVDAYLPKRMGNKVHGLLRKIPLMRYTGKPPFLSSQHNFTMGAGKAIIDASEAIGLYIEQAEMPETQMISSALDVMNLPGLIRTHRALGKSGSWWEFPGGGHAIADWRQVGREAAEEATKIVGAFLDEGKHFDNKGRTGSDLAHAQDSTERRE